MLFALGGCYAEGGLGAASGGATIHGSMGLIVHFGESANVRAGVGGALGPYRPSTGEDGTQTTLPVAVGGEVRIVGSRFDSLVASFDVNLPVTGTLHVPDYDSSEPATTLRGFAGLGYHHDWSQAPKRRDGPDTEPRVAAAITTALGAELWYGDSKSAARESAIGVGVAFSLMIEFRAWVLGEFVDCVGAKNGCD